jgi:hypothetical protein
MAHEDALPGILRHGLRSTSALLDLFEVGVEQRKEIETRMRHECVAIEHSIHGKAVIRDQKPIGSDGRLSKALGESATPDKWHRLLNSKVFFWLTPKRLETLRKARAYRASSHLILILDTKKVVAVAAHHLWLSSMNSGACMPFAHPRSPAIFRRLADYDFEYWRRKRGKDEAIVECAVDDLLATIEPLLISAKVVPPGTPII